MEMFISVEKTLTQVFVLGSFVKTKILSMCMSGSVSDLCFICTRITY